ncbi:MAG: aminotransferase class I/II-fold pyridoxal phosphate-dependent enzyme, partial [Bacteroidetes bacterium]|nr:aminotransferase class I/II-fold pyridoxal phosphate-dependent enzyme [Bacteroidota bacterium]
MAVPTLVSLSRVWLTAFKAAWDEERRKQLRETSGDALDPEVTLDALLAADAARARFPTGIPSAQAQIQARLYSGTMLSSLLPRLPDMEGAADLFLDLDWTADSLHAAVSGASDAFRYGGAMLRTSSLKGYASTVRGQSVLSTLASELSLTADTVSMGGASLAGNLLSLSAAQGSGRISASSGGTERLDSLHLQAEWQRLEDRNQLRWSDLEIDTGDGSWLLEKPATIGLYGDALTLDDLRIYDTLSVDYHILGNTRLQSSFVASRPDLAVDLQLDPISPDPRAVLFGTATPASVRQNQLSVGGTLRLPGSRTDRDSSLDLEAVVDQADVFWLTYLFPEVLGSVGGYLSGEGRITGSFAYPVFDARLGIVDGRFTVPYTQMAYGASGSLRLDREAIHFEPLRLTDGTGGYLDVDGRLLFNEYTSFTFDMQGALDEFQIMNVAESDELPFYGFLWASGDVALTGPLFNSRLVSTNGRTTSGSELFIPIVEDTRDTDQAFVVFEETPGVIPDFRQLESRSSILQKRPTSERQFLDGLNLDLNIDAPAGSIVHLVIDPLLGDVINAVSTGTIQLVLENDEFQVFGRLDVTSGDYQFTAGELFIKTFLINPGGFIEWSGDPINAALSIPASYRTRASRAGLPGAEGERPGVIPLIVDLEIGGTVESPDVELTLSIDRSNQNVIGEYQALEALLNQPDRATEYATSVLILNSFQLTTESITTDSGGQLAFNSVSQLVTAQLNRFLESALPNVDVSLGLQGESAQDLDVTYGVALRLLNERLIIRGEGVYQGARSTESVRTSDGLQGEFVVEIRIGPHVSAEIFFRRESDILESTLAERTAELKQSNIRAITLMLQDVDGINLGQGICDMPTPEPIKRGAHEAIDGDESIYSYYGGILKLREALLEKTRSYNRIPARSVDDVMVTVGSTGAFVATMFTLLDAGDEVIVFEPYYGYHCNLLKVMGAELRFVRTTSPGWEIDFDHVESLVTEKTKAIIVTTPNNPTGKVWSRDELERMRDLIVKHDLYAITDEIYEYMLYDGREHVSLASIEGAYDRTVTLSGFSKTYNMTGWRLGYAVGPEAIISKMGLLSDLIYICAPT